MISTGHFHPMLVHFPIALVSIGFIAAIASLVFKKEEWISKSSFYLLIIGTFSAFAALLAGVLFTSDMTGAAAEVQETHELFAWITLSLLIATSALTIFQARQNKKNLTLKWLAFVMYGLAAIAVSITGFYGGTLVFNYMMPL
ncbi:MAG: DUF2231 domain-containing protein [Bacteroidota bacterium]